MGGGGQYTNDTNNAVTDDPSGAVASDIVAAAIDADDVDASATTGTGISNFFGKKKKNKKTDNNNNSNSGEEEEEVRNEIAEEGKKEKKKKRKEKKKKKDDDNNKNKNVATTSETLSFVFHDGDPKTKIFFIVGTLGAIGNGLVFPGIAWIFSASFSDIGSATTNGLDPIKEIVFWLMGIGFYALVMSTIQTLCFEIVAFKATQSLQLKWFHALLRQDSAFFNVYDIGGIANNVGSLTAKYRRGLGRKFGEGIQFFTCGIGGIVYALYESWKVALVVLSFTPVISFFAMAVVQLNQTKSERAASAYSKAGSVAYSTVSGIKTVLSLNACPKMIAQYSLATKDAFVTSVKTLIKQGFVNGMMLGSFMVMYVILTLYGVYLIYADVAKTGCDPSGGVITNETCDSAGPNVFGAMLGIAFAAQGIGQVGTFLETFSTSRFACGQALLAIHRKTGRPQEIIYYSDENGKEEQEKKENADDEDDNNNNNNDADVVDNVANSDNSGSMMIPLNDDDEMPKKRIKAILPPYEIDSMSNDGYKFHDKIIEGRISFKNVEFNYPTRPSRRILNGLSIDIDPGKTIAFVGPSGGGKSTVVKLLERFYDPTGGSIELDGTNLRDINVKHLRKILGYVGQEPQLFATTIAKNIAYGYGDTWADVSQKQIEVAAKLANAHDFITSLPDKYETQVGDKGSQLSGGQKQRIAIARVLVSDPKILLLDEATSALDSESELIVQEALENIISTQKCTTIIIAHRLSTIRNADVIAVVSNGTIVETGTHDGLMSQTDSYYKKLVDTQNQSAEVTSFLKRRSTIIPSLAAHGPSKSQLGFDTVPVRFHESGAPPLIVFRNVSFSYPTRPDKLILDRFKLKVYKGETIGLCGISGGGKSTLMGLIERFYDPSNGTVEYFGSDVKEINVKWYRDQIGYVGQEPTLFDGTIADNIAFGCDDDKVGGDDDDNNNGDDGKSSKCSMTREQIIEAAKQANAYDFVMKFPDQFDTMINGGSSTQLSGGQKQRIAIARALVKTPEVLLLDEATSALDNESESIVQDALDKLMESNERTCIVIAHRLSTIRNADRIAFIGDGRVKEIGSHDELMEKPKGRYKRLVESQGRDANSSNLLDSSTKKKKNSKRNKDPNEITNDDHENDDGVNENGEDEKEESSAFDLKRACKLASPDAFYLIVGALGGLMCGSIFPAWGLLFAETIDLLYHPVCPCPSDPVSPCLIDPLEIYESCEKYWEEESDWMREQSFDLSLYWAILVLVCIFGHILIFWGFGNASERLSRRVRDSAFRSLVRQEVAFFDQRSVGKITSELQEDATMIQTFTGVPVRSFTISIASVLTGVILSFVFMWPFALLTLVCIPFMGYATSLDMKQFLGEDEKVESAEIDAATPGGIVVETLLNMGTVSALTMEETRFNTFQETLNNSGENYIRDGFQQGALAGLSQFIQQWITGALFYWGGWLLTKDLGYEFKDFLISNFAIIFSLFGLGAAFQDIADKKETEASASRIFYLLDRDSLIDPLSKDGKTLDTSIERPIKRKNSKKPMKEQQRKSSVKRMSTRKSDLMSITEATPVESTRSSINEADTEVKPVSMKKKKRSSSKKNVRPSKIDSIDLENKSEGFNAEKNEEGKDKIDVVNEEDEKSKSVSKNEKKKKKKKSSLKQNLRASMIYSSDDENQSETFNASISGGDDGNDEIDDAGTELDETSLSLINEDDEREKSVSKKEKGKKKKRSSSKKHTRTSEIDLLTSHGGSVNIEDKSEENDANENGGDAGKDEIDDAWASLVESSRSLIDDEAKETSKKGKKKNRSSSKKNQRTSEIDLLRSFSTMDLIDVENEDSVLNSIIDEEYDTEAKHASKKKKKKKSLRNVLEN